MQTTNFTRKIPVTLIDWSARPVEYVVLILSYEVKETIAFINSMDHFTSSTY